MGVLFSVGDCYTLERLGNLHQKGSRLLGFLLLFFHHLERELRLGRLLRYKFLEYADWSSLLVFKALICEVIGLVEGGVHDSEVVDESVGS